jgi:hypothetical protein
VAASGKQAAALWHVGNLVSDHKLQLGSMEHDQQTVHYVTQDDMPNLKLRVTLTLLSAARHKPAGRGGDQVRVSTACTDHTSSNPHALLWKLKLGHACFLQATGSSTQPAAGDAATAAAPRASTSGRHESFKLSRTFGWQEKVYSKAELVSAQVSLLLSNSQVMQQSCNSFCEQLLV